jgi:ABC-type transporter Mla subunit MlaD
MDNKKNYISGWSSESVEQLSVKQLFVVMFVGGALSIILGILYESIVLAVFLPCLLVGTYAALTTRAKNSDLSRSKIGDSCYFLGFSFTLISLSAALINLSQQVEATVNIGSVVGGFGAALSTTLAGLLCRLWFTTLSSSFMSSKDKLEEEIEDAMRAFSRQLQSLVEEVNLSITTIGATIGDTNMELNKSYKGQMQDNIKTISGSVASFAQRLDEVEISPDLVVKPINEAMSTMIATLQQHGSDMAQINASMVEGTSGLSMQIDQSNQVVNRYIDKFTEEFEKISNEQVSVFQKAIDDMSESVKQDLTDISGIKVELTGSIVDELNVLKNQLDSITGLTEANNTALSKSYKINESASQILAKSSERLPKIISDLEGVSLPISKSSSDIGELVESLVSFKENITESKESLAGLSKVATDVTKKLNATSRSVDTSSVQLSEDISEIYSSLAKQLRELKSHTK